jgi:hypothetical protein
VSVAKVNDGLGPVRREPSKLKEEGKLYTVAPVPVLLLRRDQVGLEDFHKVLDVYRYLSGCLTCAFWLASGVPDNSTEAIVSLYS